MSSPGAPLPRPRWARGRGPVAPLLAAGLSFVAGCRGDAPASDGFQEYRPPEGIASVDPADFIGTAVCADCHATQYALWEHSTHGQAGGEPSPVRVRAPFDGTPIRFSDAKVIPTRLDDVRYGFVVEWQSTTDTILVDGVVGGGHMVGGGTQGFFTLAEDGSQRFVPFDWSVTASAWFCNRRHPTPGEWRRITPEMPLSSCADWPPRRRLGQVDGVANCDTCHGSQILTTAQADGSLRTDFADLSINCESCHGPGREHVERVQSGAVVSESDLAMPSLGTLPEDPALETCFRCHASRLVLHPGDLPGEPLESNVSLLLPLLTDRPFLPDGRVASFAYQLNHRSSACYRDGSMTCTSCHSPHGQTYQDEFGRPLPGRLDDGQCLACHQSKAARPTEHTFHPAESAGSRCVSCHMPYLQQRSIGDDVPYARSDHTIPVPRPGLDERLGLTSACAGCHADQSPESLARQVRDWYGTIKPWPSIVEGVAMAPGSQDPVEAARLLLQPGQGFAMAQAAGLSQYLLRFVRPDQGPDDPRVRNALEALTLDPDLDVRALALASLHLGWGDEPDVKAFLARTLVEAGDEAGLLRDRWAAAQRYVGDAYRLRGAPDAAEISYRRSLSAVPGSAPVLEGLGLALLDQRRPEEAEEAFTSSALADSTRPSAFLNRARALAARGRSDEELALLNRTVARFPYDPRAPFALGNALLRSGDVLGAEAAYSRAIALDQGLANARLGLAQTLAARGQEAEARRQVEIALDFEPSNRQALQLLDRLNGG